jgi:ATP-dependent RNA helicase DDX31/DBP7
MEKYATVGFGVDGKELSPEEALIATIPKQIQQYYA